MNTVNKKEFPLGLRIAAIYLIIAGATGLIWPLLNLGPNHPEFEALSTAAKAGQYFRESLISIAMLVCGAGLFLRKAWARKGSLIVLVASAIYGGNAFAWGYAHGAPSKEILIFGYAVAVTWNAIWFYLIYRKSSAEVFR